MADLISVEARELTPGDWIRVRPRGRAVLVMVLSVEPDYTGKRVVVSHSQGVRAYDRHALVSVELDAPCDFES